ncbi:hypothetical protein BBJ28_00026532, partial [Nothophytophthora sp. Chile5]
MIRRQNQRVAGGVREDAGGDSVDVPLTKVLTGEFARARRRAVPSVLSNTLDRLLVEAVQARLDCQLEAQQFRFVPRVLQPVDPKMQWLAFSCLLLEVVKCTNLETVPLLQRAIKNEIVARSSLEVATPLLGSRPSNRRFSLVDYDTVQTAASGLASPQVTPEVFGIWKQGVALNEAARQSTSLQRRQYCDQCMGSGRNAEELESMTRSSAAISVSQLVVGGWNAENKH